MVYSARRSFLCVGAAWVESAVLANDSLELPTAGTSSSSSAADAANLQQETWLGKLDVKTLLTIVRLTIHSACA
jgi:hypothetical protein